MHPSVKKKGLDIIFYIFVLKGHQLRNKEAGKNTKNKARRVVSNGNVRAWAWSAAGFHVYTDL